MCFVPFASIVWECVWGGVCVRRCVCVCVCVCCVPKSIKRLGYEILLAHTSELFLLCTHTADTDRWGQTSESSLNTAGRISPVYMWVTKAAKVKDNGNIDTVTQQTASLPPNDSFMQPITAHRFLKTTFWVLEIPLIAQVMLSEKAFGFKSKHCSCRIHTQIHFSKCRDLSALFPNGEERCFHPSSVWLSTYKVSLQGNRFLPQSSLLESSPWCWYCPLPTTLGGARA